jgi:hypothetical protein
MLAAPIRAISPKYEALWKQRVERAQSVIVWIRVTAEHIHMQAYVRRGRDILKRITGVRVERPCDDVAAPECSPLEGAFEVVVPRAALAEQSPADRVPPLIGRALHKSGIRSIQPKVIEIDIRVLEERQRVSRVHAPEIDVIVAPVIEYARVIFDRPR